MDILGQVLCLIVSIPDLCPLFYFKIYLRIKDVAAFETYITFRCLRICEDFLSWNIMYHYIPLSDPEISNQLALLFI